MPNQISKQSFVLVATNWDNAGQIMNHLAKIQTEYTWEVTDDNDTPEDMCKKLLHKPYTKKIKKKSMMELLYFLDYMT